MKILTMPTEARDKMLAELKHAIISSKEIGHTSFVDGLNARYGAYLEVFNAMAEVDLDELEGDMRAILTRIM